MKARAAVIVLGLATPPEAAFAAAVSSHAVKYLYSLAAAPFAAYEGVLAVRSGNELGEGRMEANEVRLEV